MPNFPKNGHFVPTGTHTHVSVSVRKFKKCSFFGKFSVVCFFLSSSFWDFCHFRLKFFDLPFCFHQLMSPNPDYWICIYILLWNGDHFSCNQTAKCRLYNSRSSYSHPTVIDNNDKIIHSARKKTVFNQYFDKCFYLCAWNLSQGYQ